MKCNRCKCDCDKDYISILDLHREGYPIGSPVERINICCDCRSRYWKEYVNGDLE